MSPIQTASVMIKMLAKCFFVFEIFLLLFEILCRYEFAIERGHMLARSCIFSEHKIIRSSNLLVGFLMFENSWGTGSWERVGMFEP